jgi:hypothetical protein
MTCRNASPGPVYAAGRGTELSWCRLNAVLLNSLKSELQLSWQGYKTSMSSAFLAGYKTSMSSAFLC